MTIRHSRAIAPAYIPRGYWVFVVALLNVAGCSTTGHRGDHSDAAGAAASAAFMAYIQASNRQDFGAFAGFYDLNPDFHWVERGALTYGSGTEAAASIRSLVDQGMTPTTDISDMKVTVLTPESVLLSAQFEFQLAAADGKPLFTATDWMTVAMVLRRGRWLIAGGHSGDGSR